VYGVTPHDQSRVCSPMFDCSQACIGYGRHMLLYSAKHACKEKTCRCMQHDTKPATLNATHYAAEQARD
jgi:hypothetical protein